jgi:hypothetical protein
MIGTTKGGNIDEFLRRVGRPRVLVRGQSAPEHLLLRLAGFVKGVVDEAH